MAPSSLSEIEIVQNTALAATMIWRCGLGYQDESGSSPMPFHLSFLVLPVCMHKDTLDHVLSTQKRSGLSMFAAKVAQNREDLLEHFPIIRDHIRRRRNSFRIPFV